MMWKFILILCLPSISQCFNINIKNTKIFKGDDGSEFGYRLKFHKDPSDNNLLMLVSAPKDTTRYEQGGSVRFCYDVLSPQSDCTETRDQSMKNPVRYNEAGYSNESFGFSLSASDKIYMACAPRWKNVLYTISHGFTFMVGRCIIDYFSNERPRGDLVEYFWRNNSTASYLQQGEYFHGMATFGFSSDATDESVFAVGAPGLTIGEGGVYITDVVHGEAGETSSTVYKNTRNTTAYGFEGYDVKFGNLCDDGVICFITSAPNLYKSGRVFLYKWENKRNLTKMQTLEGENNWSYFGFALCSMNVDADSYDELFIGAPLYTDVHDLSGGLDLGRVYIYRRSELSKEYKLDFHLDGSQSGQSRFGSAIESIGDINLDKFQDVIIGAPGEEDGMGCVYIYLGGAIGLSREYSQRICASQLSATTGTYQGFGLAFSGPVNLKESSYPMFAVGSPFSDTVTLFNCRPIVTMTASLLANPSPITMPSDDNNIEDISTTVTLCLSFTIHETKKQPLDFTVEFEIDTQIIEETSKRAVFVASNGSLEYRLTHYFKDTRKSPVCAEYQAKIKKSKFLRSRFTPIEVVAKYQLDENSGTGPVQDIKSEKKKSLIFTFTNNCGDDNLCEVDLKLEGRLITSHDDKWPHFVVNHTSELGAIIKITNLGETSFWTQIQVHVNQPFHYIDFISSHIKNCDLYETNIETNEIDVRCNYYQPLFKDASVKLVLNFDTAKVNLAKESLKVSVEAVPKYEVNNPEINPDDNSVLLSMQIFIVAPVTIDGVSSPAEVAISRAREISPSADADINVNNIQWTSSSERMRLNHKLQIKNQGPSFLPKTEIFVRVPVFLPDATQLVTSLSVELSVKKEKTVTCFTSEGSVIGQTTQKPLSSTTGGGNEESDSTQSTSSSTSEITSTSTEKPSTTTKSLFVGGISRKKRSASKAEEQSSKTYMLSCQDDSKYCLTYKCQLPVILAPSGHAEINVTLTVDENSIAMPEMTKHQDQIHGHYAFFEDDQSAYGSKRVKVHINTARLFQYWTKDFSIFELMLHTSVIQPDHKLFKDWSSEEEELANKQTLTVFHRVRSGGKINLWIIIVSIAGGLILIFVITILLWKCGFFKREKHYQVEKWKRESQRRSQREASDACQNGDDI